MTVANRRQLKNAPVVTRCQIGLLRRPAEPRERRCLHFVDSGLKGAGSFDSLSAGRPRRHTSGLIESRGGLFVQILDCRTVVHDHREINVPLIPETLRSSKRRGGARARVPTLSNFSFTRRPPALGAKNLFSTRRQERGVDLRYRLGRAQRITGVPA